MTSLPGVNYVGGPLSNRRRTAAASAAGAVGAVGGLESESQVRRISDALRDFRGPGDLTAWLAGNT